MREIILLFCAVLATVHCSCPDGFGLAVDGQCNKFVTSMNIIGNQALNTANSKCNNLHAYPVAIHNTEEQSYWISRRNEKSNYVILGITCNTVTKKWQWADGSPMDYKPSGQYWSGLDKDCETGYSFAMTYSNGYWDYYTTSTSQYTFSIFCTKQLPPLPMYSEDGCSNFEVDSDDGVCYQIVAAAETWADAQMNCRILGANLASVHNAQENSFIRRLAVSNLAVSGVYLGASISGKGKNFGWIDGSEWDYENFYPGFPITGAGDCLVMDTSASSGLWMNFDCSALLPVVCIRKETHLVAPSNATCYDGAWDEGVLITSPGFPFSASTPCEFFLVVDAGKKVELELVFLQANSCCDALIVYDDYLGRNVIAHLTGEERNSTFTSTSNTMRVSWQPNGGVNVLGMAVTYRGV